MGSTGPHPPQLELLGAAPPDLPFLRAGCPVCPRTGGSCEWTGWRTMSGLNAFVSSWAGSPWVVCVVGGMGADVAGRGARLE